MRKVLIPFNKKYMKDNSTSLIFFRNKFSVKTNYNWLNSKSKKYIFKVDIIVSVYLNISATKKSNYNWKQRKNKYLYIYIYIYLFLLPLKQERGQSNNSHGKLYDILVVILRVRHTDSRLRKIRIMLTRWICWRLVIAHWCSSLTSFSIFSWIDRVPIWLL